MPDKPQPIDLTEYLAELAEKDRHTTMAPSPTTDAAAGIEADMLNQTIKHARKEGKREHGQLLQQPIGGKDKTEPDDELDEIGRAARLEGVPRSVIEGRMADAELLKAAQQRVAASNGRLELTPLANLRRMREYRGDLERGRPADDGSIIDLGGGE